MNTCPYCHSSDYHLIAPVMPRSLYRCRSCGLASLFPRVDDQKQVDYYTREYYDGTHKLRFDEQRLEMYRRDFSKAMAGVKPGRLLDFGCGLGHFMALAGNLGWETTGVDLSHQAVELARVELSLNVVQGGLEALDKIQGQFDVITLWNVLDHVNDPLHMVRVLRERLVPGGRLLLRVLNYDARVPLYLFGLRFRLNTLTKHFDLFHETVFSASSARRMMLTQGYSSVTVLNSTTVGDVKGKRMGGAVLRRIDAMLVMVNVLTFRKLFLTPSILVTGVK